MAMSNGMWIFVGLIFLAVFLLAQGMIVPVFGEGRKMRKRLQARLSVVSAGSNEPALSSLLREKYLKKLSPLERSLESLPMMESLARMIEQAGKSTPAYRVVLLALAIAVGGAVIGWMATRLWPVAAIALLAGFFAPLLTIAYQRGARMAKFEEQMPEAIDVMKRALKAGHPFNQSLKLVAEDMADPIAREFDQTFADVNYGNDVRRAMLALLERMPSITVMALVTSVLVQKETGGNLAEILEQIGTVIRSRFKFYRRVRTLSAEGRLSAWILALMPLVLFAVIWITTPSYLPTLLDDPRGPPLIMAAAGLSAVGIWWIRSLIRIDV
jgi:tight adherence protein B